MVLLKGQVKFGNSVSIFKEKLGFENTDIERAHCSTGNTSSSKPGTIVCMLLPLKQKKEVLKNVGKTLGGSETFEKWWSNRFFELSVNR